MSESKLKAMSIVFFWCWGCNCVFRWGVPSRVPTAIQHYYLRISTILRERVRRKRPELWKDGSWILHIEKMRRLIINSSVKQFVVKNIRARSRSVWLVAVSKIKMPALKGTRLESVVAAVRTKSTEVLKVVIREKSFQLTEKLTNGAIQWRRGGECTDWEKC